MAVGVLDGDVHTYRHDLESFFYVFLWVGHYLHNPEGGEKKLAAESSPRRWYKRSYQITANIKKG